jgi:HSP20 family protein
MATLSRWDPFGEMQRLTDQMFRAWGGPGERQGFAPAVDIYEDNDAIRVRAELPGVRPEDVHIDVENNVLTISGERKLEREENREGYHRIESSYGSFARSFALPESVDPDKVDAEIEQGILEVRIAKKPEVAPKRIQVRPHGGKETKQMAGGEPSEKTTVKGDVDRSEEIAETTQEQQASQPPRER